ncbi:hypothetical protein KIW84_010842 [Lathyrus oleraceus]|uniref:Uncharacterized protein n=1 Tax=Pisum sativum TaxID=3888 RepID=A0A9D5BEH1_PEA|nr:hypothetical protein KIW84_010842 [Pisum sativum]
MYHPVKCNTITRPKEEKGLGLRNLDIMNKAYLSKLGWKLYSGGEDLWCRAPKVEENCLWYAGDGTTVNAWDIRWIDQDVTIANMDIHIHMNLKTTRVVDLTSEDGDLKKWIYINMQNNMGWNNNDDLKDFWATACDNIVKDVPLFPDIIKVLMLVPSGVVPSWVLLLISSPFLSPYGNRL